MGVRIGAHATAADWSERLQFSAQPAVRIEKRFRLVTSHPLLKQFQMVWIAARVGDRNLMRAPEAFNLLAVDLLRAGPAFRASEYNHRPFWPRPCPPSLPSPRVYRAHFFHP